MKKYSWYTIVHPDWQKGEPPLFRLVGPAILPDEKTCDIYYKPNRKGGHTHNHCYNAAYTIVFGRHSCRRIPRESKTGWRMVFEISYSYKQYPNLFRIHQKKEH